MSHGGASALIEGRRFVGVFAEFERAMIRERVTSGLGRAKALGRPPIDAEKEAAIRADLLVAKAGINSSRRRMAWASGPSNASRRR